MILEPIHELMIIGVANPGSQNQERILIRPTQAVNLGSFGLCLGVIKANGMLVPLWDDFFWFGDIVVTAPSWIIVYTGPGLYQQSRLPDTAEEAHTFHWGKTFTVFGVEGIVPALFRFDGISIGPRLPSQ